MNCIALQLNHTENKAAVAVFNDTIDTIKNVSLRSFSEYRAMLGSLVHVYDRQLDSYSDLRGGDVYLDYLLHIDVDRFRDGMTSKMYGDLYRYKDRLGACITMTKQINSILSEPLSFSNHPFTWLAYRAFTLKSRRVNRKITLEAKRQYRLIDKMLHTLEYAPATSLPDGFTQLSGDDLWRKRCKAYEYML